MNEGRRRHVFVYSGNRADVKTRVRVRHVTSALGLSFETRDVREAAYFWVLPVADTPIAPAARQWRCAGGLSRRRHACLCHAMQTPSQLPSFRLWASQIGSLLRLERVGSPEPQPSHSTRTTPTCTFRHGQPRLLLLRELSLSLRVSQPSICILPVRLFALCASSVYSVCAPRTCRLPRTVPPILDASLSCATRLEWTYVS